MERSEKIEQDLFLEALGGKHVVKDVKIRIVDHHGSKLKAYCDRVDSYLNFPNKLRTYGAEYICDIIEVPETPIRRKYYRAKHGTIRNKFNEIVG